MFRIRNEQVEYFGLQTKSRFARRTAFYLRQNFPEAVEGLTAGELGAWVRRCVLKCEAYGAEEEPEATQLIVFFLLLGLDAEDKFPWARAILRDPKLLGLGKPRALLEAAREHGQNEIDSFVVLDELEDPDATEDLGEAEAS